MRRGQIYMVELEKPDEKTGSKVSNPYPGILMISHDGLEVHFESTVIIIPIAQIERNIQPNEIEIGNNLLEEDLDEFTGVALVDEIRTVDINLLEKEPIGSLNPEGIKLIDRAILKYMGIDLPGIEA